MIAIVLATYNSDKYLDQLLDSILKQEYTDWSLYIRDDGSTDKTINIINEYVTKYNNIFFFQDSESGLGAMNSFMRLLSYVSSDYYMFCDHDDIWLPFKLSLAFTKMQEIEKEYSQNVPIIVCSDLVVVDNQLRTIADSYWAYSKIYPCVLNNFDYLSVCNFVVGCTMLFNNEAKKMSYPVSEYAQMHDYWVALNVVFKGGIVHPLTEKTILYRQHENNTLGATKYNCSFWEHVEKMDNVVKGNLRRFKMINCISSISIFRYSYCKFRYFFYRTFEK